MIFGTRFLGISKLQIPKMRHQQASESENVISPTRISGFGRISKRKWGNSFSPPPRITCAPPHQVTFARIALNPTLFLHAPHDFLNLIGVSQESSSFRRTLWLETDKTGGGG